MGMLAGVQAKWHVTPVHVQCFSHWNGEMMTLTSLWWCLSYLACALGKGCKRKACKSFGAVVWVSGTEHLGKLLRSHRPSTLAIPVPLMGQEYILDELCALFIYLHVPKLLWDPFSCLVVSWVAHFLHPLKPSIGQGRDQNLLQKIV